MHFIKLHFWISVSCTVITMGQVFHTWMNDKNTAEISKIVMEELDRVSFFAGTIMKSVVFSFTFSAYPWLSGETFGS